MKLNIDQINEETFSKNLYFNDEPDLIIRTGGERRTSNFLIWQSHYSEWIFLEKFCGIAYDVFGNNRFFKARAIHKMEGIPVLIEVLELFLLKVDILELLGRFDGFIDNLLGLNVFQLDTSKGATLAGFDMPVLQDRKKIAVKTKGCPGFDLINRYCHLVFYNPFL